jgi:hypothetical protein
MKRNLALAAVFALVLAVPPIGVVGATGSPSPIAAVDLMADNGDGLGFKAGEVQVWNDLDTLYVKYVITAVDWCLMETHLAVEAFEPDIPQNKKGNPTPGHFEFSLDHACVAEYTYALPLPGFDPVIAAHAALRGLGGPTMMVLESAPGMSVYGPVTTPHAPGSPAWGLEKAAAATWVHPLWLTDVDYTNLGSATWISTAYCTYVQEDTTVDSWRWFHGEFEILGLPLGGSMVATADNQDAFFINSGAVGASTDWRTVSAYSFSPVPGTNSFDFVVMNIASSAVPKPGIPCPNPTGLIYRMEVDYRPYIYESAWGAGTRFVPQGNWATYFTYQVKTVVKSVVGEDVAMTTGGADIILTVLAYEWSDGSVTGDFLYRYTRDGGATWTVVSSDGTPTEVLVFDYDGNHYANVCGTIAVGTETAFGVAIRDTDVQAMRQNPAVIDCAAPYPSASGDPFPALEVVGEFTITP